MKNRMKKIISLVLVLAISMSIAVPAFADTKSTIKSTIKIGSEIFSDYKLECEYVKAFVKHMHDTDITITAVKTLQDASRQDSFIYITFTANNSNGYAILDLTNLMIIELSLTHLAPFNINDNIVYFGPLNYVRLKGENAVNVLDNNTISLNELSKVCGNFKNKSLGTKLDLNAKKQAIKLLSSSQASAVRKTISGSGSTSWAFKAGKYYGDCGINAIAMLEKWYDKYVNTNYLPSSLSTERNIKKSIFNMANPTTKIDASILASLITEHSQSVGLNGYYLYAVESLYDWVNTSNRIDENRPVLLSTINYTPKYKRHYVIAAGYTDDGIPSNNQLYVNDGWGGYVWLSSSYMVEMITAD